MLQVGLGKGDIREVAAEGLCFFDSGRMVDTDHLGSRFTGDLAVASAAAPGIEDAEALQFRELQACLGFERGAVFVVVGDIVARPLSSEALEMFSGDESRDPVENGIRFAGDADQAMLVGIESEWRVVVRRDETFGETKLGTRNVRHGRGSVEEE